MLLLLATAQAVLLRAPRSELPKLGPSPPSSLEGGAFDELAAFEDEVFLASLDSDGADQRAPGRKDAKESETTPKKQGRAPEELKRDFVPGSGHRGLPTWNRELTFVHVGKCAGVSVGTFMHANRLQFHEVHVRPLTHEELGRLILVPLRDPIRRTISAFNWRHPSTQGVDPRSSEETEFYRCFDSVNAFAEALYAAGPCAQVARQMLSVQGREKSCGSNHIGKGYEYYLQHVMAELPSRNVAVVRVDREHFEADLHAFLQRHGVPEVSHSVPHTNNDETHHYPKRGDTHLSTKGYVALRNALKNEYQIYNYLLARR